MCPRPWRMVGEHLKSHNASNARASPVYQQELREVGVIGGGGTSRHVAVPLCTNSIMHARANINYCGFNIGCRRWPWPTTSWAKHVKCGQPDLTLPASFEPSRSQVCRLDHRPMYSSFIFPLTLVSRCKIFRSPLARVLGRSTWKIR